MPTENENPQPVTTDLIIKRLLDDFRNRPGLRAAMDQISPETILQEITPAWRVIVNSEIAPAADAISYVLQRISVDENIRYHMGAFTEAFERLKTAHCKLNGVTEDAVEADALDRKLNRRAAAETLSEIKNIIREAENYLEYPDRVPIYIHRISELLN